MVNYIAPLTGGYAEVLSAWQAGDTNYCSLYGFDISSSCIMFYNASSLMLQLYA